MNHSRELLCGFRSDPTVVSAFISYSQLKDQGARSWRPAHDVAALQLWTYIMKSPSQNWLRRLRAVMPPLPPRYDGGGVYALDGAVMLTSSTVSGNSTSGNYATGGGISVNRGAVTLTSSIVSGNSTSGIGANGGDNPDSITLGSSRW